MTEAGTQSITVLYGALSVSFDVTVRQSGLLLVGSDTAFPGGLARISVLLSDNPGVSSAKLSLQYDPQVLSLIETENGDVFDDAFYTPGDTITAIPFSVQWVDVVSQMNNTQSGTLVTFVFRVLRDAPIGSTSVSVNVDYDTTYDNTYSRVRFDTQDGAANVIRLPGDVNADGFVNLKDVVQLRRALADWDDVLIHRANADVDASGTLDNRDVILLSRVIVGGYGAQLQ